ncbi:MAG: hypothetical protein H7Y42_14635 [Chitinophagaceae bacterium]|nr:hypothetical protein [Chitinophagaceae bacterium]
MLKDSEQLDVLYEEGVYIDKRKVGTTSIVLYQLNGFYVEVCYYKYRQLIAWVRCSESIRILDPYLDKMDIAELVVNGER